jgi:hypothetical protein
MHEAGPQRPPIAAAALSVVLLARPGFADVHSVVQDWAAWLDEHHPDYELIVVGDVPLEGMSRPKLRLVHHLGAPGMGPSLQTGIWLARQPLLFYTVCDRQFQPADLQRLLEAIDKVDLVAGYRVHGRVPSWLRGLNLLKRLGQGVLLGYMGEARDQWLGWSSLWGRFVIRRLFGLQMRDPQSPFALFRREIFRRIPIQSRGNMAAVEILAKANHLGCWIAEVPVAWTPDHSPDEHFWADLKALFRRPDFGPALLPKD